MNNLTCEIITYIYIIIIDKIYPFRYALRIETSFPEDRIGDGDGDGMSGLCVVNVGSWINRDGDVIVNDQSLSALLWGNIEAKIGRRDDLPGTRQRCRLVGLDTQEVRSKILLIVYEIC